uniref:ERC protein 2 n=1 Tax=Macrostomum lignano TaxID=282301 RepID=A0A1I8FS89_9PLAT
VGAGPQHQATLGVVLHSGDSLIGHVRIPAGFCHSNSQSKSASWGRPRTYSHHLATLCSSENRTVSMPDGHSAPASSPGCCFTNTRPLLEQPQSLTDLLHLSNTNSWHGPPASSRGAAAAAAPLSNSLVPKLHNNGPDYIAQLDGQLERSKSTETRCARWARTSCRCATGVRELEMENSALRRDLGSYSDASKILQDSVELDGIPRAELMARYAALRQNLRGSCTGCQNELIAGNQSAAGMERLAGAHESQQRLLQRLQERVAKQRSLEEACAKQEKVIEKMERLLRDKRSGAGRDEEAKAKALMEENRKLRDEMTAPAAETQRMESSERLELYQLLDKAETRIASLEKQIDAAARKQKREKARLLEDIEEAERAARAEATARRPTGRGGGQQPNVQFFAVPVPFEVKGNDRQRHRPAEESDDDYYD